MRLVLAFKFEDQVRTMSFIIGPKLLNSANVWATTREELMALYECKDIGAVTIRTSLLNGFEHDDRVHQYCFLDAKSMPIEKSERRKTDGCTLADVSSLNSLGYSPLKLNDYISMIKDIEDNSMQRSKAVIFSVTGSAAEVVECYRLLLSEIGARASLWTMEVNLSCPNIDGKPPPAYSKTHLIDYLTELQKVTVNSKSTKITIGIKTPPYTYHGQFHDLITALEETTAAGRRCPISFITATNTLGSCLVIDPSTCHSVMNSANEMGGLAGAALHPLALGNIRTIRRMFDETPSLKHIEIIGVGGVSDGAGFQRMKNAGASAVAVGTALGIYGIGIFAKIANELQVSSKSKL